MASPTKSEQIPEFILSGIKEAAAQCGFHGDDVEIQIEPCNQGDGFIGQMFRAVVEQGSSKKKTLKLICKIPPLCAARREQFDASPMFEREAWFYAKILPTFEKYQAEKGIGAKEGFFAFAKSYVAYYDSLDQGTAMIMEDLKDRGFRMYDKLKPLDYEHTKIVMEQMGRLHAMSFVLKRDRPELFESIRVADTIAPMLRQNGYFQFILQYSLKLALEIPDLSEKERKAVAQLKDNMFEEMEKMLDISKAESYVAIGHGDCWINNFMFKYGEEDQPKELIFLDWQLGRYAVPAVDLVYTLFICTDDEFREKHYEEMLQIYHRSLRDLLRKMGGDPEKQFPYDELQKQLRQFGRYGLMMSSFLVPIVCVANEDLPNLDESAARQVDNDQYEVPYKLDEISLPIYQKRMLGVIRDVVRYGYMD